MNSLDRERGDIFLVRHGETEWTKSGRHTSVTDLALTDKGANDARAAQPRLKQVSFVKVYSSPRRRALDTARLAGFASPTVDPLLAEWAYGDYEGLTSHQIHEMNPAWDIFADGGAGQSGETVDAISTRMDGVVERLRRDCLFGNVMCFGHGHALRALAMRWLGQSVGLGGCVLLDEISISVLSYYRDKPVIKRWNT